ncbi:MAG: hypothetical protein K0S41_2939 [Anaerocolumna sp.]|jgi:hypothetical protein|nr:hypothetical protein [Anaerocolumna sp.]
MYNRGESKNFKWNFYFDAKTLLGLIFVMNLPYIDVYYDKSETEFEEYLSSLD